MTYIAPGETASASNVFYPRVWIQIGDARIPATKASVTRKSTRHADTFTAETAINYAAQYGYDLATWADWDISQEISIVMAKQFGSGDAITMMTGRIDMPAIDLNEMKVSISGRDKSASLAEKRRSQQFRNQKASDIATSIAQDHGLTPNIVPTGIEGGFAGKAYASDFNSLVLNRTDWEVMDQIAEREGYRWYVDGDDLYFEPKEQDADVLSVVYRPPPPGDGPGWSNAIKLTLGKNTTAGRPHKVTSRGFHSRDKKLYSYVAQASGTGDPVEYVHNHNGKTLAQHTQLAKSRLKDRIRHELNVTVEMPADLTVDPRQKLAISGTGTIYDQQFDIDHVTFAMGWDEPATMTIEGKAAKQGRTVDS